MPAGALLEAWLGEGEALAAGTGENDGDGEADGAALQPMVSRSGAEPQPVAPSVAVSPTATTAARTSLRTRGSVTSMKGSWYSRFPATRAALSSRTASPILAR
jgi:hypothetical protein